MRRIGLAATAAGLAVMMLPPAASAQTPPAQAPLTVVKDVFTDTAGKANDLFAQDQPIHATLTVRNTGDQPLTGITGTLEFERGKVTVDTAVWPDIAPGAQAANQEPFVFSWSEGFGAPDPDCFIIVDQDNQVNPAEIVVEPEANAVARTDPATDPSDVFEPIPPGSITWNISSNLGSIEHAIPFLAVCSSSTNTATFPGSARDTLAKTGALEPSLSFAGVLFIVAGVILRRRAAQI